MNGAMCLRMPPCAFVCHMDFFWTRLRFDLRAHPMVGSWRLGSRPGGRVAAHNPIGFYRHDMLPPPPERRPRRSIRFPGSVLSTRSLDLVRDSGAPEKGRLKVSPKGYHKHSPGFTNYSSTVQLLIPTEDRLLSCGAFLLGVLPHSDARWGALLQDSCPGVR